MADISSNNIRIGANIGGLLDGMKQASAAVRGMTLDMNSKLTDAYRRASKEQAVFKGGLEKLGNDIQGLAGKMAMFGSLPALFAAGKAYKDFAELQKLEKGLKRYGESLENVREIAKLPNIGIFDAAKSLISLKSMKMSSDLATRSIKAFANAITDAGGSAIDLEPALVNLRQFKSTRHINQVDLRQLSARMPQTMDAMQGAFKTTDIEGLNKIMASIGSEAFIEKFIKELEKIPKAGGGASMEMEQLGDSMTFFSGTMGEGIDKAFDITGKIGQLGDVLDSLSSNFRNLTPEAQKSIVTLGAVAVAMPLIMGAVGGLIKLLPILATGFGLISAPVAAVIAAVVAIAAAAIISNWDSVKKFLTESTWWTTVVGIAKSALGVFLEQFKVVINLIQGDWGNMGKALVNILKNAANLIVNVLAGVIKGVLGLFGTLNEALGFEALGKGISTAVKYIDGLSKKFQFDVPDAVGTASKAIGKVKDAITGATPPVKGLTGDVTDLGKAFEYVSEASKEMARIDRLMDYAKEQQALKAKIKDYKELFGVVSGLNVEMQKMIGGTLGGSAASSADKAKAMLSGNMDRRIAKAGYLGFQKKAVTPYNNVSGSEGGTKGGWKDVSPEYLKKQVDDYRDAASATSSLNLEIIKSFDEMKASLAVGVGEVFGDALSGASMGLEDVGKAIFGIFGDLLTRIGKALISYSVVVKGMREAIKTMNPWVALGAGIIAIAAGKALKNNVASMGSKAVTKFAKAGMAYREMPAIVGDNTNARFDPEMIAPYSRIDQSIKKSVSEVGGGGGAYISGYTLRGQDIVVAFKRAEQSNKGLGRN